MLKTNSLLVLLAIVPSAQGVESSVSDSDELYADAQLTSVSFVDEHVGWAVGDRGVIWHTDDGGQAWQRQAAPVRCRLTSACFLTPNDGWIAGGAALPYGEHSQGVVLRTRDGGRQWNSIGDPLVPRLLRIQMFDGRQGWAIGYRSNFFPIGVLRTDDGGRSWSTIPGNSSQNLTCGFFPDLAYGVVAGQGGYVAGIRENGIHATNLPRPGTGHVNQLHLNDAHTGWLVGDGGLVLRTSDGGLNWEVPEGLPLALTRQVDFHAIATHENDVWIAGSPGTVVLHTDDAGKTWQVMRSGQPVTIRDLTFVNAMQGWAVGDLGLILRTDDGGNTWERQGHGAIRLAMVGFYADPQSVPLELFTRLAGDEGYLGSVELLVRTEAGRSPEASRLRLADRTHDALVAVGSNGARAAWQFPRHPKQLQLPAETIAAEWDRDGDGRGGEYMLEYVVGKIRQWRPDVVFTEPANSGGEDAVAHLVNQIVLAAADQAGDATAHTEQITTLGLEPWQIKKIFSTLPDEQHGGGSVSITTATLSKRFGRSLEEQSSLGRSLIHPTFITSPNVIGFRLLKSNVPGELGRRDFFSGISLQHGGEARRRNFRGAAVDVADVKRSAQKRRNVQRILEQATSAVAQGGGWSGQITDLTTGLDPKSAGDILFRLADRYARTGNQELAADVLRSFVQRFPQHALTAKANLWLVHYLASGETAVQEGRRQAVDVATSPHERESAVLAQVKQMEQSRPDMYAEPSVRFPLAVAYRRSGMPRESERIFQTLASTLPRTAWGKCAGAEQWLAHLRGEPPKPVGYAKLATTKPHLDGRLTEAMWQSADWLELSSPGENDEAWPAYAAINYDDEFLYLALNCRLAPNANYETTDLPRTRDAALEKHDRLDVLIDIDRDYTSAYRLTVDHRGWTNDSCFGDRGWDPQWFVAAATDDETWNVEAAIPLSELVAAPLQPGTAWAVGVQRIVPRVGFQAWSAPAAVDIVQEGFGILLFQ